MLILKDLPLTDWDSEATGPVNPATGGQASKSTKMLIYVGTTF